MKLLKLILTLSLLAYLNQAQAEVTPKVIQSYIDKAVSTLEDNGINSSDYFVSCMVSPTAEAAVCNAQANIDNQRLSESMFCSGYFLTDRYSNGSTFVVSDCQLREENGSVYLRSRKIV